MNSVLVPELAISLVKEDLGVDANRAKEIIAESADIGELLNAEEEERLPRIREEKSPPRPSKQKSPDKTETEGALARLGVLDDLDDLDE